MVERLDDLPAGIWGLRATGRLTKEDYDQVFYPLLAEARRDGRRMRFLFHLPPAFESFTAGGAWEDAQIGMRYWRLFERLAVVTDKEWIRNVARGAGAVLPCPVRVFAEAEWDTALAWLGSGSTDAKIEHRLIAETGVLVVEPKGRLAVEDFDAIALTVDPWLESGRQLQGLVIHAREFPGWESIGSFLRHIQFVRDHHKKIRRVALAADGAIAKLAPAVVEAFVDAEVQHFGYDEIDRALDWAAREPSSEAG